MWTSRDRTGQHIQEDREDQLEKLLELFPEGAWETRCQRAELKGHLTLSSSYCQSS